MGWRHHVAGVSVLCVACAADAASADPVEDFYRGKRITIVVGSDAGGGYDANARMIARHMPRHLPGSPDFVVQNMPGASSVRSANHVYSVAAKDGTFIAAVQRPIPFEPLFGNPGVQYDVLRINWLGSSSSEVGVVVAWHTTPVRTIDDMRTHELIVGGTGPGTDTELFAYALNNIYGTRFKIVSGYTGMAPLVLAMERGEIEGTVNWTYSDIPNTRPDWLATNKIRLLLQLGLKRSAELPDLPTPIDLARTEKEREVFEILMTVKTLGRPFFVAPEVPTDRVKALQDAFMATMADPEFLDEAKRQKREITPISGPEMAALIRRSYDYPEDVKALARVAVKPKDAR
ncbi:MAG: Bug family tripartite tricarboxylate transporter substrate binding protein [Gemmatimonas sp.]